MRIFETIEKIKKLKLINKEIREMISYHFSIQSIFLKDKFAKKKN